MGVSCGFQDRLTNAVHDGPSLLRTAPPKSATTAYVAQSTALAVLIVDAELGFPPPAPNRLSAT